LSVDLSNEAKGQNLQPLLALVRETVARLRRDEIDMLTPREPEYTYKAMGMVRVPNTPAPSIQTTAPIVTVRPASKAPAGDRVPSKKQQAPPQTVPAQVVLAPW